MAETVNTVARGVVNVIVVSVDAAVLKNVLLHSFFEFFMDAL